MSRRKLGLFSLLALAFAAALYFGAQSSAPRAPATIAADSRIVSVSPGITETLFAIGAGANVVGISNFCTYPERAMQLPRVGTSITPDYEGIARLSPTLIVSEDAAGARRNELGALAPTLLLPWLSLNDLVTSIRTLGVRVQRERAARELARKLEQRLAVPEPKSGPRVLLVLGYTPGKLEEVWFIRKNSLHGAALRAAGGRNAVDESVSGLPRLSLARVLEIDPDMIVILTVPTHGPVPKARYIADFERLKPMTAVKTGRISVIDAPDALVQGPRILAFADRLEHEIKRLQAE